MTTISDIAREAYGWMEYRSVQRAGAAEEERIVVRKDDAPGWVEALIYAAHGGDFLPDDWRYEAIYSALEAVADADAEDRTELEYGDAGHEWADSQVDVYTGERLAWLSSNLTRPSYCDEAAEQFGSAEESDTVERVGWGQYMEATEIWGLVVDALDDRVQELEDDDDDDDD